MTQEAITALISGLLLGGMYAGAGYLMSKRALESRQRFLLWVVGGTVVRMALALGAVITVILALPVQRAVFLSTFLLIFFSALAVEIAVLHRGKT